jgi:hypothetical protein
MRLLVGIAAGAVLCAAPGAAGAAAPAAAGIAQALFEQAREDMRRGDAAAACPKLAESQRLDPSNGTLLNLVLCEKALGKVASAWLHARELFDVLSALDDRKPIVARELAVLAPRVPKLTVRLPPASPPAVRVALDDVELGPSSLGVSVPLDPGAHRLVVRAPGRVDHAVPVVIAEAEQLEVLAAPGPESVPPPPSSAEDARSRSLKAARSTWVHDPPPARVARSSDWDQWAAFGVAAAGFLASGVLGAFALERRAAVLHECPAKRCESVSALDIAAEGQRLVAAAFATLGVGVAGAGVGAYLVFHGDPTPPAPGGSALSGPRGATAVLRFDF